MKTVKCHYKYCKNPEGLDPEIAVKDDNGSYYHLECFEKKEAKNKIFNAFCDYVRTKETGLMIRRIISDWIDKQNISPVYVLFTMNYIIQNQIPLKSIFGVGLVMKQDRVIAAYKQCLEKYKNHRC